MKIQRIPLTNALLLKMGPQERSLFLLSGHIQNELNSLNKVFTGCLNPSNSISSSEIENLADGVQAQIYARLLAGKLLEAWNALKSAYFGTRISQRLDEKLHIHSQEALKEIKTYFQKTNTIFKIRNSFAFHYSAEEFEANWGEPSKGKAFELILGGTVGNNLHLASELVVNSALFNLINPDDWAVALQTFHKEVQSLSQCFTIFLEGVILAIFEEASGKPVNNQGRYEEIAPRKSLEDIAIPHFYNHGLQ
ncbi:MAG: hypothetical protein P4M12_05750 [Gammaproteobacteria bacterium]|nr:hypothetical protein [Gammaproteobacteria bacterium]